MEYKIDVLNKFAAFQVEEDVDEDPYEALLKLKEQIIAKKVESSKNSTNKKGPTSNTTKNDKNAKNLSAQPNLIKANMTKPQIQPLNNNVSKPQPNRPPRMGGPNLTEKDNKERMEPKETFNDGFRERTNRGEMGSNRGAFRARGRGGRINDVTDRTTGKREFERHSGSDKSGFKPVEKKEGGGSHNWGSIKDDIDDQIRQNDDDTIHKEAGEIADGQKPDGEEGEKTEGDEEAVEERQMTLDEWKQQEEQKRLHSNFKIRKPGEGCRNDPKWNEMFVLKKKAEDEEEEEDEEEYEEDDDATRKKNIVPIRITFNDQQKRGGRGRGGMRGGQRRGGPSENGPSRLPTSVPAPNVDDENDFPSLA